MDQPIDHSVGIRLRCKVGDRVEAGTVLAELLYSDETVLEDAVGRLRSAYSFGSDKPSVADIIIDRII